MNGAVAIFVKTPGISKIKTRLAKSIGHKKAEEFFVLCVKAIEEVVLQAQKECGIQPYWIVAEEDGINNDLWKKLPRILSGESNLGNVLNRAYKALLDDHDYVLLIGADSPQISPSLIIRAGELSTKRDTFVIGATYDGGFYLFGSSTEIPPKIWTEIPYSTVETTNLLEKKLSSIGLCVMLETMTDVDIKRDLDTLANELQNAVLPAQKHLLRVCKEITL